jgi:hypothetical protein
MVDDAIGITFAGNPILFVGSGMGEDDILRPLRQFMGTPGWRGERVGVALLPNLDGHEESHRQKITLLTRYGVYAIHFGVAGVVKENDMDWLASITTIRKTLNTILNGLMWSGPIPSGGVPDLERLLSTEASDTTIRPLIKSSLSQIDKTLRKLEEFSLAEKARNGSLLLTVPTRVEGVQTEIDRSLDLTLEVRILNAALEFVRNLDRIRNNNFRVVGDKSTFLRVAQCIRISLAGIDDSVLSIFLCARLRRIKEEWDSWKKTWFDVPFAHVPINAFLRDREFPLGNSRGNTRPLDVEFRNAIELPHDPIPGNRFYSRAGSETFNAFAEAVWVGIRKINKSPEPRVALGRRIFLLIARRGLGKGHFFSALQDRSYPGSLWKLARLLGENQSPSRQWLAVAFFNLSFSNEVASIFDRTAAFIKDHATAISKDADTAINAGWDDLNHDRIGRIELVMRALNDHQPPLGSLISATASGSRKIAVEPRLLLAFNAVNILFDSRGRPKNAQIRKFFDAVLGQANSGAPIDVILISTESSIPGYFRKPHGRLARDTEPSGEVEKSSGEIERIPLIELASKTQSMTRVRRNIALRDELGLYLKEPLREADSENHAFVHFLAGARASVLITTFLPSVALLLAWETLKSTPLMRLVPRTGSMQWREVMQQDAATEVRKLIRDTFARDANRNPRLLWRELFPRLLVAGAINFNAGGTGIRYVLETPGQPNSVPLVDLLRDGRRILGAGKGPFSTSTSQAAALSEPAQAADAFLIDKIGGPTGPQKLEAAVYEFEAAVKAVDERMRQLSHLAGQSRFIITLLMVAVYEHLVPAIEGRSGDFEGASSAALRFLEHVQLSLVGTTTQWEDRIIEHVLELYKRRHDTEDLPRWGVKWRDRHHDARLFQLQQSILWHLAAVGEPVEADVLMRCPKVSEAISRVLGPNRDQSDHSESVLADALELLEGRCLVFKLHYARWYEGDLGKKHARYSVHRLLQRHLFSRIGAPLVEYPDIDPFTVTLYASQPNELPRLTPDVHLDLRRTVAALSGYPDVPSLMHFYVEQKENAATRRRMLRAAFGIMRSIYSVAALARIDFSGTDEATATIALPDQDHGMFEDNRRQLYWLSARALEFSAEDKEAPFRIEELVWIYNECAVYSLAQGRLLDAVPLFYLLNKAVCDIERGRGIESRGALDRIASADEYEHPVPGLIAKGLLGQLAHLRGDQENAGAIYAAVVKELSAEGQSRAASIFARQHADMLRDNGKDAELPLRLAEQAIQLAMRGGHEDIRHQAVLSRSKILIARRDPNLADLHHELDVVDRYARIIGMPRLTCRVAELRAKLHVKAGDMRTAGTFATRGLEVASRNGLQVRKINLLLLLAEINMKRDQQSAARPLLQEADRLARQSECHYIRPQIQELRNYIFG